MKPKIRPATRSGRRYQGGPAGFPSGFLPLLLFSLLRFSSPGRPSRPAASPPGPAAAGFAAAARAGGGERASTSITRASSPSIRMRTDEVRRRARPGGFPSGRRRGGRFFVSAQWAKVRSRWMAGGSPRAKAPAGPGAQTTKSISGAPDGHSGVRPLSLLPSHFNFSPNFLPVPPFRSPDVPDQITDPERPAGPDRALLPRRRGGGDADRHP